MRGNITSPLRAKIDALNREFFIGEKGTSYGGYYDYCMKYLHMVDQMQENRVPELDLSGIHDGIKVPASGSLKSAGATLLPFYEGPYYRGGLDWRNVIPGTAVPGIVFAQASKITNSNLAHCKYGGRASELEARISSTLARLVGFDSRRAAGIFVEGGTKANLYGHLLGLRKTFPGLREKGLSRVRKKIRVLLSRASHFSNLTNLGLLGLGTDAAVPIPVGENGAIDLAAFEAALRTLKREGAAVPTILLTVGTTDTFGADDVKAVYRIRERVYRGKRNRPHLHADAAIGWAMVFFNGYDFVENLHGFDSSTLSRLKKRQPLFRNLRYADSITLDFHKTGYTPYSASMVLVKEKDDLKPLAWHSGVFRYFNPDEVDIAPVKYTLECTRSPEAVFSIAGNLLAFGIEGYQVSLGWAIQISNRLKSRLMELGNVGIIHPGNNGFSTVFRVYPKGTDGAAELRRERSDPRYRTRLARNSVFARALYDFRNRRITPRDPKLDWTSAADWAAYDGRTELAGWKAYILNPRVSGEDVDHFVDSLKALLEDFSSNAGGTPP